MLQTGRHHLLIRQLHLTVSLLGVRKLGLGSDLVRRTLRVLSLLDFQLMSKADLVISHNTQLNVEGHFYNLYCNNWKSQIERDL